MALYLCDTNYNTRGSIEQFKIFMMLLLVFLIKKNSWNYQSSPLKMTNDKRPIINWIKTKKYSLFVCVFDSILHYQQQWRWQMLSLSILFPWILWIYKKIKAYLWSLLWSFSMHFFIPPLKYSSRVFLHQCTLSCCWLPQWTVANFFMASA